MSRYKFIAVLDVDELIVPLHHEGWAAMMEEVVKESGTKTVSSWHFRHVYFFDNMTSPEEELDEPHLHMLQHVYRSSLYTPPGHYVKCFHNPDTVLTLHNHFAYDTLFPGGRKGYHAVDTTVGHLAHYRASCVGEIKKSCWKYKNASVRDTTLRRWGDRVITNTSKVLNLLNLV